MSTHEGVLGVPGVCWVGLGNSTQRLSAEFAALRAVCQVCWVHTRAGVCARFISLSSTIKYFLHAKPEKPNTPNTLNAYLFNVLIYIGFICVGFVLGCLFCVLGFDFGGIWG
jgi:hypothetical protein